MDKTQIEENLGTTLSMPIIAALLAIPGILSAKEITAAGKDKAKIEQVVNAKNALDSNIIARTLFGEGRNQGEEGLRAIMSVIWNRAGGKKEKLVSVCLAKKQFSYWNGRTDTNKNLIPTEAIENSSSKDIWELCKKIASEAMNGTFKSTIGTRNSYFNPSIANPSWKDSLKDKLDVNDHLFGYLPEHDGFKAKASSKKIPFSYTVVKGDNGINVVARKLLKKTEFKKTSELAKAIMNKNPGLKKDKNGNPIIKIGQKLSIPVK